MGRLKHRAKKKRLFRIKKIRSPPFWAHIRKFGLKRTRTRRVVVNKEKKWREGGRLKA
ncbi:MAG: hypothetical protein J7K87_02695 [Candidatus Aenigmarchaeota archaeon]|nr:hypothetical protein [Candidatus Aenigmarchaeota archaeon]